MTRNLFTITVLAGLLLWGSPASALESAGAQRAIDSSKSAEKLWSRAWGYTWAGATVVQLGLIPVLKDDEMTIDLAFGAGGAALGLIPTFIYGPWILRASEAEISSDPERALIRDRADKTARCAWYNHVGNVVINVGLAAGLGYGYGHWVSALLTIVTGIPIGEAMILSQPGPRHSEEFAFGVSPILQKNGGGLALALQF